MKKKKDTCVINSSIRSIVLEQTVLAEIALIQTINNTRSASTTNYRTDDPYHISMEDRLDSNLVKPIQSQLIAAIQVSDPNNANVTQKEVQFNHNSSI